MMGKKRIKENERKVSEEMRTREKKKTDKVKNVVILPAYE